MCLTAAAALIVATSPAVYARAQGQGGGLHTLNPPSGGVIVYGTLKNQPSQAAGMVYMLHQVHGHYGDKPALGSTGAYATFPDSFADDLVKSNPGKLQSVTNRQLQAAGEW